MNKESFILYTSFYKPISKLSDKQLGRLFRAVFRYNLGEVFDVEEDIEMAFEFFKNQFEIDESKYQSKVMRDVENGRKGGNPNFRKGQSNPYYRQGGEGDSLEGGKEITQDNHRLSDITQDNPALPKITQDKAINDNDNENVNENEKKIYPYRDIVDRWNAVCGSAGMAKVLSLTEKRKKKIRTRLEEMEKDPSKWLETIEKIFRRAAASDFLRGAGGGWKASFDWVFENSENWLKIMEGRYDNNNQKKSMGGYDGTGSRQGARRTDVPPAASVPAGRGESIF